MMPSPQTFTGQYVALTLLDPDADSEELFNISHEHGVLEKLWQYMFIGPFADAAAMRESLKTWQATPDVIAFTVRDIRDNSLIGSISLMNIRPDHGVAELGYIWYSPAARRTKVNTESNYLLLKYCFEELGYRRMEWKCDSLNEPSRRAAERLGYRFEGIFRQHMIVKGKSRDTAWFSMLNYEWPGVGEAIAHWLYRDDSLPLGTPIIAEEP